ncbi:MULTISPECIES: hypothetical protein [unclassified Methanoculleus]|jgi:hypothetical protein|uniref:Uncharacterized protein n=1 Tax=Methanoculleus palmolei TaxID=72612 RepID=A0ABD8A784_9EURY|nr:hypothetical protein R6Y95_07885 [Methanoculleus palmolei]
MAGPEKDTLFTRCAREAEALSRDVMDEIACEERRQSSLFARDDRLHATGPFILAAFLANLFFLLILPHHFMPYWIASSFILYMVNPFILMIPTGEGVTVSRGGETVREVLRSLRATRGGPHPAVHDLQALGKVLWDIFFINSQPLAAGFGLIFGVNILFALFCGYVTGSLETGTAALITLQSLAIVLFYAGIWYFKPYTTSFFLSLDVMRVTMQEKIRAGWRAAMQVVLVVAVIGAASGVLAVSAMLLPGVTFSTFLASVNLVLGWDLLLLAVIFASQVTIVRYLQGAYSRELSLQVSDYKVHVWRDGILNRLAAFPKTPEELHGSGHLADLMANLSQMQRDYQRMKVYASEYHSIFGFFPVCLVLPDICRILDRSRDTPQKAVPEPDSGMRTERPSEPTGMNAGSPR